jgi:hypothetical protein
MFKMTRNITILKELEQLVPVLATVSTEMHYQLPESYFIQSTENIQTAAFLNAANTPTYTVFAGYFDSLSKKILNRIYAAVELNETAPLLASLKKENVYQIPQDYFHLLQSLEGIKVERKVKIISIATVRKLVSYAAAAVMAGILITGAFLYSGHKGNFDLSNEVNKVSDEELQNYLSSTTVHPYLVNDDNGNTLNADNINLKEEIQFVSDEELQEYVDESKELAQKNNAIKKAGS